MTHISCPVCGTLVLANIQGTPEGQNIEITVRTLKDVSIYGLELEHGSDAASNFQYQNPETVRGDPVDEDDMRV